jgi:hypothetical protein
MKAPLLLLRTTRLSLSAPQTASDMAEANFNTVVHHGNATQKTATVVADRSAGPR